jgi:hypothetical protein
MTWLVASAPCWAKARRGEPSWGHALNRLHDGLDLHNVEIWIQILDQSVARCLGISRFQSPDGGISARAIPWWCSYQGHHDDEATLFCGVLASATPDLKVIVSEVMIRGRSWCRGAWCSGRWLEDVCPDWELLCCFGSVIVRPCIRIETWSCPAWYKWTGWKIWNLSINRCKMLWCWALS